MLLCGLMLPMKKITYDDIKKIPASEVIGQFSYRQLMDKLEITSQAISMMLRRERINKDKLKILLRDHPNVFRRLLQKTQS